MNRKLLLPLLALFLLALAAVTAAVSLDNTLRLSRLARLHDMEGLRGALLPSTSPDRAGLAAAGVRTEDKRLLTAESVEERVRDCSGCHHAPSVSERIAGIEALFARYGEGLPREPAKKLLTELEDVSRLARARMEALSAQNGRRAEALRSLIHASLALGLLLGVLAALRLSMVFARPVDFLREATRRISSGRLPEGLPHGAGRGGRDELAAEFDAMMEALGESLSRMEEKLARRTRSERFVSSLLAGIRDPLSVLDGNFVFARLNADYAALKGLPAGELLGKPCYRVLHGRDGVCPGCVAEKAFRSKDPCREERRIADPEGSERWMDIYYYPVIGQGGEVTHVIQCFRDVTERKRTEEGLRKSAERYALAARGANEGLWDWDLRRMRVYYSPRWKSMLGFDEKDIGDSPEEWFRRVHPRDREHLEAKLEAHLAGKATQFECEYRVLHRDSTYRWVLSRGLAVRDRQGEAVRIAGSQTDVTERKMAEEQLVHDAFHDTLTGLPNRALFINRLEHGLMSGFRGSADLFAVLFLDLDRFKVINDSLGHSAGDKLLEAVSQRLQGCLRQGDTVARFGGDEFAILLEKLKDKEEALNITGRIQEEISRPFALRSHEVFVTASIGLAFSSVGYTRADDILRDADIAMYRAKGRGRACHVIFDTRMHADAMAHLTLETELRRATENREFVLHYQPVLDLASETIVGFEALLRWEHPKRGLVMPQEFIPLAEETGLIMDIGAWVLREACRQLAHWQKLFPMKPPLSISANISSRQFSQSSFLDLVSDVLAETGLDPRVLSLELTESVLMENAESAATMLNRLRHMGVGVHIDDFGTGYSSLSYIHRFPITALKIDRSFVRDMNGNQENLQIVKSIIFLAHNLRLDVIVEGLEQPEQVARFKRLRCRYGQGFVIAEPMEAGALERWLETRQKTHAL
ncbi:MAG: EAL domain-containing protein [Nitrospirota bacterium]